MASPAIGQQQFPPYPSSPPPPPPLLLDKEQQLFLQSLSANERKKILKRSASTDTKPPPRRSRQQQQQQQQQQEEEDDSVAQWGSSSRLDEEDGGSGPRLGGAAAPAAEAGAGQERLLLPPPAGPGGGAAAARPAASERTGLLLPPGWQVAAAKGGVDHPRQQAAAAAEELLLGAPPRPAAVVGASMPASPSSAAAKPHHRSGLQHQHHQRLRLRRAGAARLLPDVRTIFEQSRDPRVREEKGEGHRFEAVALWRGWCDLCGRDVHQQRALRCANCKYTSHQECRSLIQLDCSQQEGQTHHKPSPENTLTPSFSQNVTKTAAEEKPKAPTIQELKQKIDNYNSKVNNCLLMKLNDDDGTYTGFIKVHLKLCRPVTVPAGIRPQSIYDALKEVNLATMTEKRTSFYLPLDAIKQLHISSTTTVSEVIQGLLKKFMVVDNPQKFALFKQMQKDGQVLFQKLSVTEYPLYLRLLAGPDTDILSFVLKENETGEVEWDAFSIPELQNFLVILEREEKDKIQQVQKKYDKFKQKLQEALKEANGKPG